MDEEANASNVQVTVRCRPMNRSELAAGNISCFGLEAGKVVLTHPTEGTRYEFVFDHMYEEASQQETVYTESAAPILDKAFAGFNGTIFAYGQTGQARRRSTRNCCWRGMLLRFCDWPQVLVRRTA